MMSILEKDNLTRFHSGRKGFYEVYFLKCHLFSEALAFWIRYTLHAPLQGAPHGDVWAFVFDRNHPKNNQGNRVEFPVGQVQIERDMFYLKIGESTLFQNGACGSLPLGKNPLEWDLRCDPQENPLRLFPFSWMYRGSFPKTKYLVPHPNPRFSGKIVYRGKELKLEKAPGEQAHLWGRRHAERWVWAHANTFEEDPSAIFEGLSVQIRMGSGLSPPLTVLYLKILGKDYLFNGPLRWFRTQSRYDLQGWAWEVVCGRDRFIGTIWNDPSTMMGVRYTDPDGSHRFCHHHEWASMRLDHYRKTKGQWEYVRSLHSEGVSFEVVDSKAHPPVEISVMG